VQQRVSAKLFTFATGGPIVVELVEGTSGPGEPRVLTCWREGGSLMLWIHPPDSEDGYELRVPADRLFAGLVRALTRDGSESDDG
jgi:hypothetical protein